MSAIQKYKTRGQKGRGLGHVTYFSILGSLNIFGISKAINCPRLVNGDDANLRTEPPSWSRGRAHGGRGPGKVSSGDFAPETKHLHNCQSILLAILFKNVLWMLKISQPVTFSTHTSLYQLEASCRNLISSWQNSAYWCKIWACWLHHLHT